MFAGRSSRHAWSLPLAALAGAVHLAAAEIGARTPATAPAATTTPAAPFAGELGLPLQRLFSSDDYDGFSRATAVAHTAEGFTVFGT